MTIPVISDTEAIKFILLNTSEKRVLSDPRFAFYLGAGTSVESGVPSADKICKSILQEYLDDQSETEAAIKTKLRWNQQSERYSACISAKFPTRSNRVDYFRQILQTPRPSFAHYALALLATERFIKPTFVTSNFDKLLEKAFVSQGIGECQAIRNESELVYWSNTTDKYFLLKLHGDYDTDNVMNTIDETIAIPEPFQKKTTDILDRAGLVVLGSSGNEKSVIRLFEELENQAKNNNTRRILSYGLLWAIYIPGAKPKNITDDEAADLVRKEIAKGDVVHPDVVRIIQRMNTLEGKSSFFPIWGAGNFFFELVKRTRDKALLGKARLYFDQDIRLRTRFSDAGYSEQIIEKHLEKLWRESEKLNKRRLAGSVPQDMPKQELKAHHKTSPVEIQILYGDITRRTYMSLNQFEKGRRAIISSDDTFISAGGGVAAGIMVKAGQQYLLNELSKFSQLKQGTVLVTSGGDLPVHYIFHAAAIEVNKNPTMDLSKEPNDLYLASIDSVRAAMVDAVLKATELKIRWVWVSLMASGTGGLKPRDSLEGILQAISGNVANLTEEITFMIFVYSYNDLEKHVIRETLASQLGSNFTIENA